MNTPTMDLYAVGAYGRQANSADWHNGKDFAVTQYDIRDPVKGGRYFSKRDSRLLYERGYKRIVFHAAQGGIGTLAFVVDLEAIFGGAAEQAIKAAMLPKKEVEEVRDTFTRVFGVGAGLADEAPSFHSGGGGDFGGAGASGGWDKIDTSVDLTPSNDNSSTSDSSGSNPSEG